MASQCFVVVDFPQEGCMFATQLKELESRCADIAQMCRRVSLIISRLSSCLTCLVLIHSLSMQIKRKIPAADSKQNFQFSSEVCLCNC